MIISEKQMREIESLIPEHGEALVAFGADMYRQGIFKGALILGGGIFVAGIVINVAKEIHEKRKLKKSIKKFGKYVDELKDGDLKIESQQGRSSFSRKLHLVL